ncbi:hypothetical protein ILUMI_02036 [Ignelater luminosus]|uniref:Uncharacterized protein n=1 Tax=Ignelater luminosus TaxID=2038154 RepID=A0A8K0DJ11_IGNLU|nr:hypothetical protein ILUMI_02036 [Ignelater luminosus]
MPADFSKCPPYIPRGSYKMVIDLLFRSIVCAQIDMYMGIVDIPIDWRKKWLYLDESKVGLLEKVAYPMSGKREVSSENKNENMASVFQYDDSKHIILSPTVFPHDRIKVTPVSRCSSGFPILSSRSVENKIPDGIDVDSVRKFNGKNYQQFQLKCTLRANGTFEVASGGCRKPSSGETKEIEQWNRKNVRQTWLSVDEQRQTLQNLTSPLLDEEANLISMENVFVTSKVKGNKRDVIFNEKTSKPVVRVNTIKIIQNEEINEQEKQESVPELLPDTE